MELDSSISHVNYSAENVIPFTFDDPARHDLALRESLDLVRLSSHGGQEFSGLHLNRDYTENPVIVRIGSMNSSSTTDAQKYIAYQYAAAFPENPVVAIDLPSHGQSDRNTLAQRYERLVEKSGSLTAHAQAEAIANRMIASDEFIIIGDSFGAQLVPDVATKIGGMGLKPLAIIGFDMSGVNNFNTCKTFLRLNKARKQGHDAYHRGEANIALDNTFEDFCTELGKISLNEMFYSPFNIGKRDPLFTALTLLRPSTNSENGLEALEKSLELNDEMLAAMVSGGLSRICNWSLIKDKVINISEATNGRLDWQVWPNDSHSMSIAPQHPRSVKFAKDFIEGNL